MSKKRGKRPGLKARSKNARKAKVKAKGETRVLAVMQLPTARQAMCFYAVEEGPPADSALVLVRLKNGIYRYGMMLAGAFAAHDYHSEEFVTFPHPDWITHWMQIVSPVPHAAKEEAETPQAEIPQAPAADEAPPEATASGPDETLP